MKINLLWKPETMQKCKNKETYYLSIYTPIPPAPPSECLCAPSQHFFYAFPCICNRYTHILLRGIVFAQTVSYCINVEQLALLNKNEFWNSFHTCLSAVPVSLAFRTEAWNTWTSMHLLDGWMVGWMEFNHMPNDENLDCPPFSLVTNHAPWNICAH